MLSKSNTDQNPRQSGVSSRATFERSTSKEACAVMPNIAISAWRRPATSVNGEWNPPRPARRATQPLLRGAGSGAEARARPEGSPLHAGRSCGSRRTGCVRPIDCVDFGIARIAVLCHPLLDATAAGIVAGERHDVGAAVLLEQSGHLGCTHLGVVDRARSRGSERL